MPTTTFVARKPGPFSALVQAPRIGGLALDPHPPVRVLDRYFDTDDGVLLRTGFALRARERDGSAALSLRPLDGGPPVVPDLDLATSPGSGRLSLPPGDLADAVVRVTGGETLRQLLSIRLYRTPRLALDGGRPAGVVSFDVVVYEVPGARVVSNEVEAEPAPNGSLLGLVEPFADAGLEQVERSRLERAVLRLSRALDEPALLLPDEHAALHEAASGDGDRALRARVLLLDARGFRTDTIAAQTGLSMGRVRAVRQRFRDARLAVLDAAITRESERAPEAAPLDDEPSGDGHREPEDAVDMADLIELFTSRATFETPLFAGDEPPAPEPPAAAPSAPDAREAAPSQAAGPAAAPAVAEPVLAERPRFDPYPVVLGPVPVPEAQGDGHRTVPTPDADLPEQAGETPVLRAAEALIGHRLARFDARAERFSLTRAPSDARRLLVATHELRLAVETFEAVLPQSAAERVVAGLRPLAASLGDALDIARAAAATRRQDLARLAADRVGRAADRLGDEPTAWGDRARRLVARLGSAAADGLRSDDAPLRDDYVGPPGDAPTATRLRHLLASSVWDRFEAVRAFEDDLEAPTPALAAHLAVALSGLHAVLELAGGAGDLRAALGAAERAVVDARGRHLAAQLGGGPSENPLGTVVDIWRRVVSPDVRGRLSEVAAAI